MDPTQPTKNWKISTQPKPWVNPTHGQLWSAAHCGKSRVQTQLQRRLGARWTRCRQRVSMLLVCWRNPFHIHRLRWTDSVTGFCGYNVRTHAHTRTHRYTLHYRPGLYILHNLATHITSHSHLRRSKAWVDFLEGAQKLLGWGVPGCSLDTIHGWVPWTSIFGAPLGAPLAPQKRKSKFGLRKSMRNIV